MMWTVVFTQEAEKDYDALDGSIQPQVESAIYKVAQNPLPKTEGGYGTPLGGNLAGLCRIKLRKLGIRIVYKLVRTDTTMKIIVIAARADDAVYEIAAKRNE